MNLRWEILNMGIIITPSRRYRLNEVYIPSFSSRVQVYYKSDKVWVKINNNHYSMDVSFEDGKISENIINAIVGIIRYHKADQKIKF